MFESIPDYRNGMIILVLIKNDSGLLHECGFLKRVILHLCKEFQKPLNEKENETYVDSVRNEEE